jgi:hypothetical protein
MSFNDFSSWPREQEATFVVYEQRGAESQRKAWTVSGAFAAVWLVFGLIVYFGISPDKKNVMEGTDMSNLTKKAGPSPKAETPKAEPKAEAPKADAPAAEAPSEAPAE